MEEQHEYEAEHLIYSVSYGNILINHVYYVGSLFLKYVIKCIEKDRKCLWIKPIWIQMNERKNMKIYLAVKIMLGNEHHDK